MNRPQRRHKSQIQRENLSEAENNKKIKEQVLIDFNFTQKATHFFPLETMVSQIEINEISVNTLVEFPKYPKPHKNPCTFREQFLDDHFDFFKSLMDVERSNKEKRKTVSKKANIKELQQNICSIILKHILTNKLHIKVLLLHLTFLDNK